MDESNCKHYLASKLDCNELNKDYESGQMCALIIQDGTIGSYDISDRGTYENAEHGVR